MAATQLGLLGERASRSLTGLLVSGTGLSHRGFSAGPDIFHQPKMLRGWAAPQSRSFPTFAALNSVSEKAQGMTRHSSAPSPLDHQQPEP